MEKILMLLRRENEIDYTKMYSKNFDIEIYTDVVLGLQAVKTFKPKLLVIDFATSRISGIELVRIIRSNPNNYHTKIIVTAKNFNLKLLENSFAIGADYFIKYPFNIDDLEKIYGSLKYLQDFSNIELIASSYDFDWAIGIWDKLIFFLI